MDWYVIQAYSGYEQKVKAALEERIMLNNLSDKFGEILIPTEQIVELKAGFKIWSPAKLINPSIFSNFFDMHNLRELV